MQGGSRESRLLTRSKESAGPCRAQPRRDTQRSSSSLPPDVPVLVSRYNCSPRVWKFDQLNQLPNSQSSRTASSFDQRPAAPPFREPRGRQLSRRRVVLAAPPPPQPPAAIPASSFGPYTRPTRPMPTQHTATHKFPHGAAPSPPLQGRNFRQFDFSPTPPRSPLVVAVPRTAPHGQRKTPTRPSSPFYPLSLPPLARPPFHSPSLPVSHPLEALLLQV